MAKAETTKVKLTSARVGHTFDRDGRLAGAFTQAAGEVVDMPSEEARRYLERGLATTYYDPDTSSKRG